MRLADTLRDQLEQDIVTGASSAQATAGRAKSGRPFRRLADADPGGADAARHGGAGDPAAAARRLRRLARA